MSLIDQVDGTFYLRALLELFIPEFLFQKIHLESASVVELRSGWGRYEAVVKVHWFHDTQIVNSRGFKERRGVVKISRKLHENLYPGATLHVFCQDSRFNDDRIQLWIAS